VASFLYKKRGYALQKLRIPITWVVFNDLLAKDDIKTFIYGVSPSISEEEIKQGKEDIDLDGDDMDKEETNIEGHDEEEHKGT